MCVLGGCPIFQSAGYGKECRLLDLAALSSEARNGSCDTVNAQMHFRLMQIGFEK